MVDINFKEHVEYLKGIYETEYNTKISLTEFWNAIRTELEERLRGGSFAIIKPIKTN